MIIPLAVLLNVTTFAVKGNSAYHIRNRAKPFFQKDKHEPTHYWNNPSTKEIYYDSHSKIVFTYQAITRQLNLLLEMDINEFGYR